MIIFRKTHDSELPVLFPHIPKCAGSAVKDALAQLGLGALGGLKTVAAHVSVEEAIRNHRLQQPVRVLAIGRHPYARALSLFRFLKNNHARYPLPDCPSEAVVSDALFKAAASYTHGMGRAARNIISGRHGIIPERTQLFRVEDQFDDWLDAVENVLGLRPEVHRLNVSPNRWRDVELNDKAKAHLREVWGEKDWRLFGYD